MHMSVELLMEAKVEHLVRLAEFLKIPWEGVNRKQLARLVCRECNKKTS